MILNHLKWQLRVFPPLWTLNKTSLVDPPPLPTFSTCTLVTSNQNYNIKSHSIFKSPQTLGTSQGGSQDLLKAPWSNKITLFTVLGWIEYRCRQVPKRVFDDAKQAGFDMFDMPCDAIRPFMNCSWWFMSAHHIKLTGKAAAWDIRKQKNHRSVLKLQWCTSTP